MFKSGYFYDCCILAADTLVDKIKVLREQRKKKKAAAKLKATQTQR
jgi:hypothetical protein